MIDARGLASAVVIAAWVMQPRGSTLVDSIVVYQCCGYGVMSAPHHRDHVGLTHVVRTSVLRTGSGDPWPDSLGGEVGLAPIPSLNFKLRRLALSDACLEVPVSVLLQRCMHAA